MKTFTQIPPGTQILLGRAARRRRALERAICSVFEGWSYEEIVPPIFDYYDVFIKGMGTGLEEQIYRFIDRDGNILALRPEFTSLVAKTVVTRLNKAARPIRLYYSGEVLRFEKPKGGRQREFAQIGVEHFGSKGKSSDIEILLIAAEAFERLGIPDFQMNLGSVDFFGGIVDRISLPEGQIAELKEVLSLKDQSGLETLLGGLQLEQRRKDILRAIPHLTGGRDVIKEARGLVRNDRSIQALDHLEEIYTVFEKLGLAGISPSILVKSRDSITTRAFSFAHTCPSWVSRLQLADAMTDSPRPLVRIFQPSAFHLALTAWNRSLHRS
jgi:ATP phosphoribosyltransferase regulatory subunit